MVVVSLRTPFCWRSVDCAALFYPVDSSGSGVWLLLLLTRLAATTPPPTRELHRQRLSLGAGSVLLLLNTGHCTLMVGRLILDFVLSLSLSFLFLRCQQTHTHRALCKQIELSHECVCVVLYCASAGDLTGQEFQLWGLTWPRHRSTADQHWRQQQLPICGAQQLALACCDTCGRQVGCPQRGDRQLQGKSTVCPQQLLLLVMVVVVTCPAATFVCCAGVHWPQEHFSASNNFSVVVKSAQINLHLAANWQQHHHC